jgi:hypothetical protein
MKKNRKLFFVGIVLVCIVIAVCTKSKDKLIPSTPFELVTIYDEVLLNATGEERGIVKLTRPIFRSNYQFADAFNSEFDSRTQPLNTEEIYELFADQIEIAERYDYDGFRDVHTCEATYYDGTIVSFKCILRLVPLDAVHGSFRSYGKTFNLETGKVLKVTDVLSIPNDLLADTLYREYIAYHAELGDGIDIIAQEGSYINSVKEQCGEDAVFWLDNDGLHIFFHEYTFYYALGSSELVIPYTRNDLFRTPFRS